MKLVGDRGINICNVTCFSSDGASAMVGAKGGLRTRLNKYIYSKLHMEFDEKCYLFFSVHYVCHRVNLSVDDVFKKEGVERRVSELADKIEIVVKYCYNFFSRSPERRREYQKLISTFSQITLPSSWCDTRWYAIATVEWASSSALKYSHEAQFVISSLTDEVFMRDMRVTRQALRVLYRLSIRLQYNAQSPWQAFLIIQRAVGLMEDVEEESEDAGQALAK